MGKALYRKYRSKKLSEIVGQEHITTTLSNALKSGQFSHAYLFTGPRGVGKTSVARILAHEVNSLPYNDDTNYLDIIEIDAASNRRIDEIRQLRERINLAPAVAKYKVYIIDEVHMLTKEAFNALLKTLEEPPDHVIFILATTEAHKIPETISSRTQQFNFRPISASSMAVQLKKIANTEKIEIDEPSLLMIAEYGQGSFRDSLSLLDQASSIGKKITTDELNKILGMAPDDRVNALVKALENNSAKDVITQLDDLYDHGYNVAVVSKQLLLKLRASLNSGGIELSEQTKLDLMKQLIDVPISNDSDILFEIILLSHVVKDAVALEVSKTPSESTKSEEAPEPPSEESNTRAPKITHANVKVVDETKSATRPVKKSKLSDSVWPEVLASIKNKHNTLYGIARMAAPSLEGNKLTLTTKFSFHERTLNEQKNENIISDTVFELTGNRVVIEIVVDKKLELDTPTEDNSAEVGTLSTINNIFGNAEVLE